jgi:minimal PKS acyl carrier protein
VNGPFSFDDLADVMKSAAGIAADPLDMAGRPDATFADFGLDSLGLMAVAGEVEHHYGTPLGPDTERCETPHAFIALVNSQLTSGV